MDVMLAVIATLLVGIPVSWWAATHTSESRAVLRLRQQRINDLMILSSVAIQNIDLSNVRRDGIRHVGCRICTAGAESIQVRPAVPLDDHIHAAEKLSARV